MHVIGIPVSNIIARFAVTILLENLYMKLFSPKITRTNLFPTSLLQGDDYLDYFIAALNSMM